MDLKFEKIVFNWNANKVLRMTKQASRDALEDSGKLITADIQSSFQEMKSGRIYPHPDGGTYRASGPYESPAYRTGKYASRMKWRIREESASRTAAVIGSNVKTKSGYWLGLLLEMGAPRNAQAPRPHLLPALMRNSRQILTYFKTRSLQTK